MYYPIQQWSCHNNIEAGKGLNLFDDCAAECVYLCHQEEECTSSSWTHIIICTLGTMTNWQTDRQCTNWNRQKWRSRQSKNFIRTRDTIRHLQTFRVISNEMPVLLLILCWCYFSCLKKCSEKFFNAYFYEQILFEIFVAKRDTA